MKEITKIIKSISTECTPHLNPTEIYNEGWMTRLLVHYSVKECISLEKEDFIYSDFPITSHSNTLESIRINKSFQWTSEALISSPFVKKEAKPYQEGYTHADMAIGDFDVDYLHSGEIDLRDGFNLFGIIEAKMGSNLSKGTTHAPNYNQASRNLACIAYKTKDSIAPTFFGVVAPKDMITKHGIQSQVEKATMIKQIEDRYDMYPLGGSIRKDEVQVLSKAQDTNVFVISYEDWIAKFDNPIQGELQEFYNACLKWNKITK